MCAFEDKLEEMSEAGRH